MEAHEAMTISFTVSMDSRDWLWRPYFSRNQWHVIVAWACFDIRVLR